VFTQIGPRGLACPGPAFVADNDVGNRPPGTPALKELPSIYTPDYSDRKAGLLADEADLQAFAGLDVTSGQVPDSGVQGQIVPSPEKEDPITAEYVPFTPTGTLRYRAIHRPEAGGRQ
jgi:hypothetical protein